MNVSLSLRATLLIPYSRGRLSLHEYLPTYLPTYFLVNVLPATMRARPLPSRLYLYYVSILFCVCFLIWTRTLKV
jgi:hypothetical protein